MSRSRRIARSLLSLLLVVLLAGRVAIMMSAAPLRPKRSAGSNLVAQICSISSRLSPVPWRTSTQGP